MVVNQKLNTVNT
ncbi:hypothetical protein FWK35_00005479 [Aphis craccivora]|nr:hypothetical protein FWK35_00005479 [Aphis craccivora]